MLRILLALCLGLAASPGFSQSTITLDDLDMDSPEQIDTGSSQTKMSDMETCLLDQTKCSNSEFKATAQFSLDDVVNLGIIDRQSVKPVSASNSNNSAYTQALPSIDMEILFDYNSDQLKPDQFAKLLELSKILSGDKFKKFRFAFLGHTDAKGSREYNTDLSRRRAHSVSEFIRNAANLPLRRVIASGLGSQKLKDLSDPFGASNRRVQIVLLPEG